MSDCPYTVSGPGVLDLIGFLLLIVLLLIDPRQMLSWLEEYPIGWERRHLEINSDIYITLAHGDHFFGNTILAKDFPKSQVNDHRDLQGSVLDSKSIFSHCKPINQGRIPEYSLQTPTQRSTYRF
jgi:hypothetical protein